MLVLSRKVGESIIIGDQVEITVLENHSHEIKLGITAPRSISILRKEIYEAVKSENLEAARLPKEKSISELVQKIKKRIPPSL